MRKSGVYPRFFRVFGGFFTRKSALIDNAEELTFKDLQKFLAQIQKKFPIKKWGRKFSESFLKDFWLKIEIFRKVYKWGDKYFFKFFCENQKKFPSL